MIKVLKTTPLEELWGEVGHFFPLLSICQAGNLKSEEIPAACFVFPFLCFFPLSFSLQLPVTVILTSSPLHGNHVTWKSPLVRSGQLFCCSGSRTSEAHNALWLHRSGVGGSNIILMLCCELSRHTWVEKRYAGMHRWALISKAALGPVWFYFILDSNLLPVSSTPLIPPSPSYWPPLAHTAPIFIRLIAAVFATFPTTPSVCAPLRLWRELRPVTWGINCVVETCILWGMRGRCRPSFGSAVVPRTGREGTAGLRLCYWRSYGAGRDIYCLREVFTPL